MIYTSLDQAKRELQWLTQECSLPHFASSRLTAYEYLSLENRLTTLDDKSIRIYEALIRLISKSLLTNDLAHESLPVLALIPDGGMRIIIEHEADGSWKSDGANGTRNERAFPKNTLFTSIKSERSNNEKMSATQMFKDIAIRQKPIFIHAAIASFSINALALGTSFYSMQVYDRVIPTQGVSTLVALSIGVFIAIFLEMVLKLSRSTILDHASKNMDVAYSHDIFNRFLKIRSDALPKSIGTLSGQLQSYATVRAFISTAALYLIIDFPFSMIFLAVIIMIAGWPMGLIALLFLLISIITGSIFRKKIEKLSQTSSMASHKKLGLLVETVENAENIKATGAGWSTLGRWNALTEDAIHDDILIRRTVKSRVISRRSFSKSVMLWGGAYLVATTDTLTMGGLIATTILSGRVLSPIAMLPNLLVQWGRTKIAVKDLDNVYALHSDNEGVERPLSPVVLEPNFRCTNVEFAYEKDMAKIKIANLTINKGERVAILGVIGSGKSTLLKILSGFICHKSVLINGIDIQHISRNRLNETIGYCLKTSNCSPGTLRDTSC
jgi:ATP-binding cassette subfamily C protein LapB